MQGVDEHGAPVSKHGEPHGALKRRARMGSNATICALAPLCALVVYYVDGSGWSIVAAFGVARVGSLRWLERAIAAAGDGERSTPLLEVGAGHDV